MRHSLPAETGGAVLQGGNVLSVLQAYRSEVLWIALWALGLGLSLALYALFTWMQWIGARGTRG
jgi:hypothetical protein